MTFKEIQDKVLALMDEEGDTDTVLTNTKTFINDALVSRCNERKWPWMLSDETVLTLEVSQPYALLPSDFNTMHWVKDTTTGRLLVQIPLDQRFEESWFYDYDVSGRYTTGDYVIFGDKIRFFTITASATPSSVTCQYYKTPTELVDDTDEPDMPTRFHNILVWDAIIGLKGYHGELENIEYLLERQRRAEAAMYAASFSADSVGHKPLQVRLGSNLY